VIAAPAKSTDITNTIAIEQTNTSNMTNILCRFTVIFPLLYNDAYPRLIHVGHNKAGHTKVYSFGSPAVFSSRPVAFRPFLTKGLALSGLFYTLSPRKRGQATFSHFQICCPPYHPLFLPACQRLKSVPCQ
jgi:hypothetical protein